MSRNVLVAGGVAVIAAIVAIFVLGRDGKTHRPAGDTSTATGSPSQPGASSQPGGAGGDTERPSLPSQPGDPMQPGQPMRNPGPPPLDPNAASVTPRDQPRGTSAGSGSAAGSATDSYAIGDVHVRDHRGGSQVPMDIPPNVHPPGAPLIDSTLTNALGQQVRTVILTCAKAASRDGRGATPRVEGQIIVAVKANVATVLESVMQPRDLDAAATTTLKACVESKAVGLSAPAPDQVDLTSYSINLTVMLP